MLRMAVMGSESRAGPAMIAGAVECGLSALVGDMARMKQEAIDKVMISNNLAASYSDILF